MHPCRVLCPLRKGLRARKRGCAIGTANTDGIEDVAVLPSRQVGVAAARFLPAAAARVYIPRCEQGITYRAIHVTAEKTHFALVLIPGYVYIRSFY